MNETERQLRAMLRDRDEVLDRLTRQVHDLRAELFEVRTKLRSFEEAIEVIGRSPLLAEGTPGNGTPNPAHVPRPAKDDEGDDDGG